MRNVPDVLTLREALGGADRVLVRDPARPWELVERPALALGHRGPGERLVIVDGGIVSDIGTGRFVCRLASPRE